MKNIFDHINLNPATDANDYDILLYVAFFFFNITFLQFKTLTDWLCCYWQLALFKDVGHGLSGLLSIPSKRNVYPKVCEYLKIHFRSKHKQPEFPSWLSG